MYKFDVPYKLISFSQNLPNEFLEKLVDIAFSHINSQRVSKLVISQYDSACRSEFQINGYRKASDVRPILKMKVKKPIMDFIKSSEIIFLAILSAWFEARQELKEECQEFVKKNGIDARDIQNLISGFNYAILEDELEKLIEDLNFQVISVDKLEIRLMLTVLLGAIPMTIDTIDKYPGKNLDSTDLSGDLSGILSNPQMKNSGLIDVFSVPENNNTLLKDQTTGEISSQPETNPDTIDLPNKTDDILSNPPKKKTSFPKLPISKDNVDTHLKNKPSKEIKDRSVAELDYDGLTGSLSDILSKPLAKKTIFTKTPIEKRDNDLLQKSQIMHNQPIQSLVKNIDTKESLAILGKKLINANELLAAGNLEGLSRWTCEFEELVNETTTTWRMEQNKLEEHVEGVISEIRKISIHDIDREGFIKKINESHTRLKSNSQRLEEVRKIADDILIETRQFVKLIEIDLKNLAETESSFVEEEKVAQEWGINTEHWSIQLVTLEEAKSQPRGNIEQSIKVNRDLRSQICDSVEQFRMELTIKMLKESTDLLTIVPEDKKQRLVKINEKIPNEVKLDVLRAFAAEIEKITNEVNSSQSKPDIVEAAKIYLREPDPAYLDLLVNGLAKNRRHNDVYLLLSAVLAKGIWQSNEAIEKTTVDSYFEGLRDRTPQDRIFNNLVVQLRETQFVNQIKIEDPKIGLAIAILYLSALAVRPDCLNPNDLWRIYSDDIKILSPLWGGLLEQTLQGNLPIIRTSHKLPVEELNQIISYLDIDFGRESGRYIRIRGKNSIAMTNMETQILLPLLDGKWAKLKTVNVSTDDWEQIKSWLAKTNETTLYDEVCRNADLDPNESPFFRHKIEERIRKDLQYFDKFIKIKEEIEGSRINNFLLVEEVQEALQKACQYIGELYGFIAEIILSNLGKTIVLSDEDEESLPSLIEKHLIESSNYWNTMPNAVAYVGNNNTLKAAVEGELIKVMVSSFAEPIIGEELALFYLRNNLPQIAEAVHSDPAIQENASLLKQNNKELLNTRQADLKKSKKALTSEENQWLSSQRWNLLFAEIDARLETIHNQDVIDASQLKKKYTQLVSDANKLEIQIMQASFIPPASMDELLTALDEIKTVCRREMFHCMGLAENLLAEVNHILDYKDANLESVMRVHSDLKDAILKRKPSIDVDHSSLTIGKYVEALRKGDFDKVGVSHSAYTDSMIDDRVDFLNLWQAIKKHPNNSLTTEAEFEDRRQFFSLFAKIVRVEYGIESGAKSIAHTYRKPIPHFESVLMKPGADALRRNLIFIALTSDVNPRSLKELDRYMDEEKWLKNGKFVIWFALDNYEAAHDWARRKYTGKSVIVIDENALIRILFSGDNPTSTGVFRGMLLRTVDSHSVSVFWYENWVDNDKSIFVGREDWIRAIIESGQSHVIYGGRRIGKSSLLKAIEGELHKAGVMAIYIDLEGARSLREGISAAQDILERLEIYEACENFADFHKLITKYFVKNPGKKVMILFDELDPYIRERRKNKEPHMLIETCRNLFTENRSNIRFVMAGFIELWKQLRGDSDISGQQNPYKNFLFDRGELTALQSSEAQKIVKEGFQDILGYQITDLSIPRRIVDATTGHPAFVQKFCERLFDHLHKLGTSGSELQLRDVDFVRDESGPLSFTSFVVETLGLNINNLSQLIVYLIAAEKKEQFTVDDIYIVLKSYDDFPLLTKDRISESVHELLITGVFSTAANQNFYKFSVPSYSNLLRQYDLTDKNYLDNLIQRYTQAG